MSNNGYKVYDDIKWEYPPEKTDASGNPTYSFPGCFIAKAGIQIPPGVDKKDLGIQIVAYNQIVGTMQCDASTECQDKSTANQPAPPWLADEFCKLVTALDDLLILIVSTVITVKIHLELKRLTTD